MEFAIEKCAMLIMRKWQMTGKIEVPNQGKIRMHGEKGTYKYMVILEVDTIKQVDVKEKIQKEYFRGMRKLLETEQYHKNLIKRINI